MIAEDRKRWEKVFESIKYEDNDDNGGVELGRYFSHMLLSDAKHIGFTFSRYKFVSKLLCYREHLRMLEFGCQEAIGALIFQQNCKLERYTGVDFDEAAIAWNRKILCRECDSFEFLCGNFFDETLVQGVYDAIISLDVIEHIERSREDDYIKTFTRSMNKDGVAIIGTPSIMMDAYASEASKVGHINLYDQERLYRLCDKYFHNVFIFNMNDEVVHTGFSQMSCYFFAVCTGKRE